MNENDRNRRSACPINFALEIFGDRWTLLVLRDLLLMHKRHFRELLACEEGIASNILADRLKRLETWDIIDRAADPDDGRQFIYRPTKKGLTLIPVLLEIAAWGAKADSNTDAPDDFCETFASSRDAVIRSFIDAADKAE